MSGYIKKFPGFLDIKTLILNNDFPYQIAHITLQLLSEHCKIVLWENHLMFCAAKEQSYLHFMQYLLQTIVNNYIILYLLYSNFTVQSMETHSDKNFRQFTNTSNSEMYKRIKLGNFNRSIEINQSKPLIPVIYFRLVDLAILQYSQKKFNRNINNLPVNNRKNSFQLTGVLRVMLLIGFYAKNTRLYHRNMWMSFLNL